MRNRDFLLMLCTLCVLQRIPDASITADAIVGFPGETEKQFQDTLSLMDEVVFDSVNTAAYSPRPNTPAAVMDNQIDDDVKQDRLQRINIVNLQHAAQRRSRMMDRVVEILVEERNVRYVRCNVRAYVFFMFSCYRFCVDGRTRTFRFGISITFLA